MNFQSTQLSFSHSLLPLLLIVGWSPLVSGQETTEEPAQSVLKEEAPAEATADPAGEEPKEFKPPAITLV